MQTNVVKKNAIVKGNGITLAVAVSSSTMVVEVDWEFSSGSHLPLTAL